MSKLDRDRFHIRKNPRLNCYDYTSRNYYFITICTHEKKCIFGYPGELSPMGIAAADCLQKLPAHFSEVKIDKWVVMPNHIHAIVILPGDKQSLSTVMGQYKAAVSKAIHTFCPGIPVW